jgi:hypothetical protein
MDQDTLRALLGQVAIFVGFSSAAQSRPISSVALGVPTFQHLLDDGLDPSPDVLADLYPWSTS